MSWVVSRILNISLRWLVFVYFENQLYGRILNLSRWLVFVSFEKKLYGRVNRVCAFEAQKRAEYVQSEVFVVIFSEPKLSVSFL